MTIAPNTRIVVNIPENVSLHGTQALITAAGGIFGKFSAVEYPAERGRIRYTTTSCELESRDGFQFFIK